MKPLRWCPATKDALTSFPRPVQRDLVRGRTDGFTIEQLLRLFGRLGYDIPIKAVRRHEEPDTTGQPRS